MSVTIVVEDGTGVDNANSWVTLEEARAYAGNRGVTLPADDDAAGAMLVQSGDFLNSFRDRYKGVQTYRGLPMVWPRYGANVEGAVLPDDEIPDLLKTAQFEAVIAVNRGVILLPSYAGGELPITREKVGPLETEFADPFAGTTGYKDWRAPSVPGVMAALKPLLVGIGQLRTQRI